MDQIEQAIEAKHMELSAIVPGAEAEMVLVWETIGAVDDLVKAVENAKIEGLEWLGDLDEYDIAPDDDFYPEAEDERDKPLGGRLYLVLSNRVGVQQLLALWREFKENEGQPKYMRGLGRWKQIFTLLKAVRPWGVKDRLTAGVLEDWAESVRKGDETVRVEIELWPRRDTTGREQASAEAQKLVEQLGGEIVSQSQINEIDYHALLAKLPITAIQHILANDAVALVKCEYIMFFQPTGQMSVLLPEDVPLPGTGVPLPEEAIGTPAIAILDGLPLENHVLLAGRLVVDDPDGWSAEYPANQRAHGTAMASLIIHGDLQNHETPLTRPVYVRPILRPAGLDERAPEDILLVDLVHGAVRRIFAGTEDEPAAAPTVRVINFSVGDPSRLFDRAISPLARLLDWLSTEYKVLFVVSAGNHVADAELSTQKKDIASLRAAPERLRAEMLRWFCGQRLRHPLYSPAEGLNVVTVGALHSDSSAGTSANPSLFDPLDSPELPSPYNAQGPGLRRSIKPEVLAPGGRIAYRDKIPNNGDHVILEPIRNQSSLCGQRVATPGMTPGDTTQERLTFGTSNAAALVTRSAGMLCEVIDSLRATPGGERITREYEPTLLKALVVHSASWGGVDELLWPADDARKRKKLLAQLLGYGHLRLDRVLSCADHRVTLIGFGSITAEQGQQFALPLPPSLNLVAGRRTLVSTLAWFTSINPRHNHYRRADLWFDLYGTTSSEGSCRDLLGVKRCAVDIRESQRGTVQHEILTGDRAVPFAGDEMIKIQVNCRADAGEFSDTVPYALVVTLEVEPEMGIDVYNEVLLRIRQPVPVIPQV